MRPVTLLMPLLEIHCNLNFFLYVTMNQQRKCSNSHFPFCFEIFCICPLTYLIYSLCNVKSLLPSILFTSDLGSFMCFSTCDTVLHQVVASFTRSVPMSEPVLCDAILQTLEKCSPGPMMVLWFRRYFLLTFSKQVAGLHFSASFKVRCGHTVHFGQ